jgi:aryl-alcohol dehydrogenase-like predicted oxidoreductase
MRYIELACGVRSSILGFGCAPVLGAVGRRPAELALRTALDEGIIHFDIAPSYGYGEAETFVGQCLAGVRDDICIATKFGINTTASARWLRPIKPAFRLLRRVWHHGSKEGVEQATVRNPALSIAKHLHRRIPISVSTMRDSLEKSLRAIRTDRIDILLLHEPIDFVSGFPELADLASTLKQEGKIRAWGLATTFEELPKFQLLLRHIDVLQFNVPAHPTDYQIAVKDFGLKSNILFSPFRSNLRSKPSFSPTKALKCLWDDFPNSIALCSMFNPEHIRENARSTDIK